MFDAKSPSGMKKRVTKISTGVSLYFDKPKIQFSSNVFAFC